MTTLIVDDSPIFLRTIAAAVEHAGLSVIGHAKNLQQARHMLHLLSPRVVCIETELSATENGLDLLAEYDRLASRPKTLLMAKRARPAITWATAYYGLDGFCAKTESFQTLCLAFKTISEDRLFWTEGASIFLQPKYHELLTDRELAALHLIARYCTDEEGARQMSVTASYFGDLRRRISSLLGRRGPELYEYCEAMGFKFMPLRA